MSLSIGTFLQDRYEILDRIGSGGMSDVYKAQCHTLNRLVAIKVLKEEFTSDDTFVKKFKMEAQAAARLSNPNIVNVYDVVDEGELHYIVMELVDGITLKQYIEKKGKMETKEAIGVALQVAKGIAAAHENHIIHRDIKPQNIIISRDGKVKVADFGIARAVSAQTAGALAVGSVHYIAPEQAKGLACDARSDIYSFGITMYEMVTGQVPFQGDTSVAVAMAHIQEPVTPPGALNPETGRAMEQIILKCIQKEPNRRYSSVADVIADLHKAILKPESDLMPAADGLVDEMGQTKTMSPEEMAKIQEGSRQMQKKADSQEETAGQGEDSDKREPHRRSRPAKGHRKPSEADKKSRNDDVSRQFERIVTVFGIVAAIIIVAVVVFVFSRLGGLFNLGSGVRPTKESVVTEGPAPEVTITNDQVYVPSVLGMPQDMAEARLKEESLVMRVTGSEYSDNYDPGQVMAQEFDSGSVVKKWATVGVTISKGSDRVDLAALNLTSLTGAAAKTLLEEKGLTAELKPEYNDGVPKDMVIRCQPEEAKVGDSVELFVSQGPKTVEGQVPHLVGQPQEAALAMLAAVGLQPGEVTSEPSDTVPPGVVITQSEMDGTILPKGSPINFVVSSGAEGETVDESEGKYYLSSIDTTCNLSNYIGPASQTSSLRVAVRLKQRVNNEDKYETLIEARTIAGSQTIPVSISRIKGYWGVDTGEVEVVDVTNNTVIQSYPISFFPVE